MLWAGILLLVAWALGLRLTWWCVAVAAAGGVVCTTLSTHFGLWAPAMAAAPVFSILVLLQRDRHARHG